MQVYLTKCKSYLCRKHNDNKIDSFIIYIKKKNITKTIAGVIKNKITTYLKKKIVLVLVWDPNISKWKAVFF